MVKITFLGAGSTVFAKNILGDCMLTESLREAEIALYDIDGARLDDSLRMVRTLNSSLNADRARISAHVGPAERAAALEQATFVVNAIQVGGYEPATVIDFEIPKAHGLRQTIGDTVGIGGIFRGLRTLPVMLTIAREMEQLCPDALLLNYTNPMAIVTGGLLRGCAIATVGLCHSVQQAVPGLLGSLGLAERLERCRWRIAGINHMAWLLELSAGGEDLYPEVRRRAAAKNEAALQPGGELHWDMVRYELMRHFGYYVTESSEHNAEYTPYWIKSQFPELVQRFNIPLDEYLRRCREQIAAWRAQREALVERATLEHQPSHEYGSRIMDAVVTGRPIRIHGNLLNHGLIDNLPADAVVEVPCLVDRNGVQGVRVGPLPPQLAALNLTNINVHQLTIAAALTGSREHVYHAAALDPHTAAELPLDRIRALCDDLIAAHGDSLPPLG